MVCLPGPDPPGPRFRGARAASAREKGARAIVSIDYRGRGGRIGTPTGAIKPSGGTGDLKPCWTRSAVISRAIFVGTVARRHACGDAGRHPARSWSRLWCSTTSARQLEPRGSLNIKTYIGQLPLLHDLDKAVAHFKRLMGPRFPAVPDEDWRFYAGNSLNIDAGADAPVLRSRSSRRTMDIRSQTRPCPTCGRPSVGRSADLALRGENSDLLSPETHAQMASAIPCARSMSCRARATRRCCWTRPRSTASESSSRASGSSVYARRVAAPGRSLG